MTTQHIKAAHMDTTAAICGQLAGAFYGGPALPGMGWNGLRGRSRSALVGRLFERHAGRAQADASRGDIVR